MMSDRQPLVTIYIPTHNRSALLQRALASVLAQTYPALEIIVVNDGSQDETNAVVQALMSQTDDLILLENESPRGACYSRNRAIDIARGEFITGLDDDDELKPDHIETLLKHFDPELHSFVSVSTIEDTGQGRFYRDDGAGVIGLDAILHNNVIGNQVLTRTQYLQQIGGFDVEFPASQDYDTWVRLIQHFGPGLKLREATYVWHTGHEMNRITNNNSKRMKALDMFYRKHSHLMSEGQKSSFKILQYKSAPDSYSLFKMLKHINRHNYKSALSLYVNLRLPMIGRLWRQLKIALNRG
ncbi:glycosyltransferase [Methylophaga thalassica]|uniref:glycosyltransferase n=1 Tax=Methylophaga aminisulfidivorans TaxID=230105 RepID=UPI003A8D712D